jgi:phenylacetate-CoA ligase
MTSDVTSIRLLGDPPPNDLLDDGERLSADELAALQLVRLQTTLRHEYVPHYRVKFDEAGVGPADCHTLDDLARFPFTTKEDLRATYPFGMFAVPMSQVRRVHACTRPTAPPVVRPWSAIPRTTSTCGPMWSRAAFARPVAVPATRW